VSLGVWSIRDLFSLSSKILTDWLWLIDLFFNSNGSLDLLFGIVFRFHVFWYGGLLFGFCVFLSVWVWSLC